MKLFLLGSISGLAELPFGDAVLSPLKAYTGPLISRWLILYEMHFTQAVNNFCEVQTSLELGFRIWNL